MADRDATLEFPFDEQVPDPGHTLEVAPGVHWLRMPLQGSPDHINLWLLEDSDGWTAVDCGVTTPETIALWEQHFAFTLRGRPITRVLVTHFHSDHFGLAHWLCERWDAPLWMSQAEYLQGRLAQQPDGGNWGPLALAHLRRHGLADPELIERLVARAGNYTRMVPAIPPWFRRIVDGDAIPVGAIEWVCIAGYGHAPEHMALHARSSRLLIAGDMLLPRISANVGVSWIEPEGDPLTRFRQSIERFRGLPPDTMVLPSHGRPFRGIATRLDQMQAHHAQRLEAVLEACAEPMSATDLLPVLFHRRLAPSQVGLALNESLAHLNAQWHAGALRRECGEDGVYRFVAV